MAVHVPRVAIRCDGGTLVGAGHVGRCAPVARAFADAGAHVTVVGSFDGLARELVDALGLPVVAPRPDAAVGIEPAEFDAALIDVYGVPEAEVCAAAAALPVATMAEAVSCPERAVQVDFHLDRSPAEDGPRLLAGGIYAPVDPAFKARASRPAAEVRGVLVTLGGSQLVRDLAEPAIRAVATAFPDAAISVAGGLPVPPGVAVTQLDPLARLAGNVGGFDLAVTGAGMTTYELACAGVPFVALVLVDNQTRVVDGLKRQGVGVVLDVRRGLDRPALTALLATLAPERRRRELATAGRRAIDGDGAARVVRGLAARWRLPIG